MPDYLAKLKTKPGLGIALGVLYGLTLRISFQWKLTSGFLEIISAAFLIAAPFVVGAIAVFFMPRDKPSTPWQQLQAATIAMLFFLIAMFVLVLEGVICIVLVAPVFFIAASIGALVMGQVIKHSLKAGPTLNCLVLLPFLLGAIESQLPAEQTTGTVANSVIVNAPAQRVFDQIARVENIQPEELGFSFMHLLGLPRPIEADMSGTGVGAVRLSKWEQGVNFKERITQWLPPHKMYYAFEIPAGSIPREALDQHVELGGKYFTVLNGGYDIEPINEHQSRLSLHTVYLNKSNLKLYGNAWSTIALADFHHSILHLIKTRAENSL
jgi:hypothetical protein